MAGGFLSFGNPHLHKPMGDSGGYRLAKDNPRLERVLVRFRHCVGHGVSYIIDYKQLSGSDKEINGDGEEEDG